MPSIRTRLIAGTTSATLIIYVIAAIVLYVVIRRSLLAEFDAALSANAPALVALTEQTDKGIKLDLEPGEMADFAAGQRDNGFLLRTGTGQVIARSGTPGDGIFSMMQFGADQSYGFATIAGAGRVRYAALSFVPRAEEGEHLSPTELRPTLILVVTRTTHAFDEKLHQLMSLLLGVFGVTALSSAAIMAYVIKRGLSPLRGMAQTIHAMGHDDLSKRITLQDSPDEVRPVVERLNQLLARLEASFDRERAFTADVAHELRTPLAGLTTALEVCGSQPRLPEDYARVIGKCLSVSRSMHAMVENLLTLARADARQLTPACDPIDLGTLLHDVWHEFEPRAEGRQLHVQWSCDTGLRANADKGLISLVLRNLFDNAVTYANTGGAIHVQAAPAANDIVVSISNSGSEVAATDSAKVFDRFWRGDTARNATGQHCGLGLALCQRIVTLLGGSIAAETTLGGEFTVTLRLGAGVGQ